MANANPTKLSDAPVETPKEPKAKAPKATKADAPKSSSNERTINGLPVHTR